MSPTSEKTPAAPPAPASTTATSSNNPISSTLVTPDSLHKETDNDYIAHVGPGARTDSSLTSTAAMSPERLALEKQVVRKLDWRILPSICLAWMLFYLDRAAIGYALINGLVRELNLHGVQINVMMMLYFVPFLLLSIPGNLLVRKVGPGRLLSIVITSWGVVTLCTGFVKSYAALCVMRILMGITESFFLGGVMLYLGFFYTAKELTARTGIFYSSTSISAAIGGLLASGLGSIHTNNYYGWSWIFFIEGIITICIGIFAFLVLPVNPSSCHFLSTAERDLALSRMMACDMKYQSPPNAETATVDSESAVRNNAFPVAVALKKDRLAWPAVRRAIFNPLTPMMALACFFNIETLTSYIMFLPTIVQAIVGPEGSRLKANLLTVPPNIAAFIATIIMTQWSQRWGRSGIPMICSAALAAIGFILLIAGSEKAGPYQIIPALQYVGTFFVGMGVASLPPIALAWVSVNTAPHYVRALVLGFVITIGNLASFLSSFTYIAQDAPKYVTGHSINLGCLLGMIILGCSLLFYMSWENGKRARGDRDGRLDPKHWEGKMTKEEYEIHLGWDHPHHRFAM